MMTGKATFATIGAVVVPAFEYVYGTGEAVLTAMSALVFFIILDWMSGIRAAKKDFSYSSKYGIDGVIRTFFMLALPGGGHLLDMMFNLTGILFGAMTLGLLYHIIQSMVANAIRAGWGTWLPLSVFDAMIKWVGSELDKKINRAAERGGVVGGAVDADTDTDTSEK